MGCRGVFVTWRRNTVDAHTLKTQRDLPSMSAGTTQFNMRPTIKRTMALKQCRSSESLTLTWPPSSFLIFCNRMYVNKPQRVTPFAFFGTMRHFPKEKNPNYCSNVFVRSWGKVVSESYRARKATFGCRDLTLIANSAALALARDYISGN